MERGTRRARGFSYLEILLAIAILGGVVSGAAMTLELGRSTTEDTSVLQEARFLLQDAIGRVHLLHRMDREEPGAWGIEPGDVPGVLDDVDDLDGLSESPPIDCTGTAHGSQWRRVYIVDSLDPWNPSSVVADGSSTLMRVTVSVRYQGEELLVAGLLLSRS